MGYNEKITMEYNIQWTRIHYNIQWNTIYNIQWYTIYNGLQYITIHNEIPYTIYNELQYTMEYNIVNIVSSSSFILYNNEVVLYNDFRRNQYCTMNYNIVVSCYPLYTMQCEWILHCLQYCYNEIRPWRLRPARALRCIRCGCCLATCSLPVL